KEYLVRTNDDLRTEKSRLQSQIHELQNQNAQLIEDHTRDVLSIKAKETQLVRARSDAESAEGQVGRLGRELERLKREVRRVEGERSESESGGIYHDRSGGSGGDEGNGKVVNGLRAERPQQQQRVNSSASSLHDTNGRMAPSYISSPSEEKENDVIDAGEKDMLLPKSRNRSPVKTQPPAKREISGEGGESWKRAAEVTTQLRARIEMMKGLDEL
ncbi:MAG: hypothetical protein Q9170_006440, partial [Blastenia crenularia]